ncbi:unnamed protein product [Fraxinus pennsylvanica]|uniref:Uncharacterized protein n=1 Tax=Fraxinus pennsylvanica TaxID=56036 RepID=A0AAD1ZK41_9LAMI|nr:unnamed protein product [Fraxinus pennsylvanica]
MSGGLGGNHRVDDPRVTKIRASDTLVAASWTMGMGGERPEISLPPDATNTLFVEGLPVNCTRKEVSRILSFVEKVFLCFLLIFTVKCLLLMGLKDIFRPFVGYKESMLVAKESRHVRTHHPFQHPSYESGHSGSGDSL